MVKNVDEQILEHQQAIAALERERDYLEGMTPNQRLARALHENLCRFNHTDQCEWFYEVEPGGWEEDWDRPAHTRWADRAISVRMLLPDLDNADIIEVAKVLGGMR